MSSPQKNNKKQTNNFASNESKINFEELVQQHGYVKARQLIKQSMVDQHQQEVEDHEVATHQSYNAQRVKEAIKQSATSGQASNYSLLDKLLLSNRKITSLERALLESNGLSYSSATNPAKQQTNDQRPFQPREEQLLYQQILHYEQTQVQSDSFYGSEEFLYTLQNTSNTLLIPNKDIAYLPSELGETILQQTRFIQEIKCSRNQLTSLLNYSIPQYSLYHIQYIVCLDLSFNQINTLPPEIGILKYLKQMNLSYNSLSTLPHSFQQLKSLKTLNLSNNNFTYLSEEFQQLSSLISLNLSSNLFVSLPYPLIKLPKLKQLHFQNNQLNHLAIFQPFIQPKDIWMTTINPHNGKNLYINLLTKEKIDFIEKYDYLRLKKHKELNQFQAETMNNLIKYRRRKMYLSLNQIQEYEIDFDMISGTIYYRNNVSGNTSWEMPASLNIIGSFFVNLYEINLTKNAIKVLPSSLTQIISLKKIILSKNRLKELPENIHHWKHLEYFDVSSNELMLLPINICLLSQLKTLLLQDNHLIRLPEQIGFLPSLTKLNLSINRLNNIPYSLGYCSTLSEFEIAENPIQDPALLQEISKVFEAFYRFRNSQEYIPKDVEVHDIYADDSDEEDSTVNETNKPQKKESKVTKETMKQETTTKKTIPNIPNPNKTNINKTNSNKTISQVSSDVSPIHFEPPPHGSVDFNNPSNPLNQFLWYLRNKYMIDKHGKSPMMEYHGISIQQEITILKPELNETIQNKIDTAKKDGFINLQLLGLQYIPLELIDKKNIPLIKKIKFDFNPSFSFYLAGSKEAKQKDYLLHHHKVQQRQQAMSSSGPMSTSLVPMQTIAPTTSTEALDYSQLGGEMPLEFKHLTLLSFRACKLYAIPENIYILERIMTLNLEENLLEFLPNAITELVTLTHLNVSKNRLYELPEEFYFLKGLQYLNLESNYLEELPTNLSQLTKLKHLNLAKNRLSDIPESIADIGSLTNLNIEKNRLFFIPSSLSKLSLLELKIGHNNIEYLPNNLFSKPLNEHLRLFSCVENNLLTLPDSIINLNKTCQLEADYNPLITPPSYLLSENNLELIQNYFVLHKHRKLLMIKYLREEDFVLSSTPSLSFSPVAHEILEDGTGFLTPEDLMAFDQAMQEFVNDEFFKCPATAEEILQRLVQLRDDRELEMYLLILRTFLRIVKELIEKNDERFMNGANIFLAKRPWGRAQELCNVYCISLTTLLRDISSFEDHPYYPMGRPSIFQLIAQELPPICFPFTMDLLKDSIRLYNSPYGQIADTEQIEFPTCDCIDTTNGNRPKKHKNCTKVACVVVKSLYIDEEAQRREIEEDELLICFEETEFDIKVWLNTKEGKKELEKEIRKRKDILKEEMTLRDEMILSIQYKQKKASETLKNLEVRRAYFDKGMAYETHGFSSNTDAITQIQKTQDEVQHHTDRLEILRESKEHLQHEYELDWKTAVFKASEDLIHKYCFLAYEQRVAKFRRYALDRQLYRHWDGEDGDLYDSWKAHHIESKDGHKANHPSEEPLNTARSDRSDKTTDSTTSKKGKNDKELPPEFDWKFTEEMERYHLPLFDRYRNENPLEIDGKA